MLQTQIADASSLTKVVVLVPGNIEEPKTIVSGSLRPDQENRFVRVVEAIAKDIAASPFFLVAKRYRCNADTPGIPYPSDQLVELLLRSGCGLPWVA